MVVGLSPETPFGADAPLARAAASVAETGRDDFAEVWYIEERSSRDAGAGVEPGFTAPLTFSCAFSVSFPFPLPVNCQLSGIGAIWGEGRHERLQFRPRELVCRLSERASVRRGCECDLSAQP